MVTEFLSHFPMREDEDLDCFGSCVLPVLDQLRSRGD